MSLLLVASRWIEFASTSLVFGSASFWFYARRGTRAEAFSTFPLSAARSVALLRAAALLAAVSGIGWLAATIANVTGGFENVADPAMLRVYVFETPFGAPSLFRLALLIGLAVLAIAPMSAAYFVGASAIIGASLLVSQAWFGHAAVGGAVIIASYIAHVLSGAGWIGGLPPLALAIAERRGADRYALLSRYSALAIAAVGLIILSGIANTAFHVSDLDQLASTSYGLVLCVKLSLVAAMLAFAAVNRFVLLPRLRRDDDVGHATNKLQRNIAIEIFCAVLVLGTASVLGITPPPH